jgi:hypothetical protein
MDTIIAILAFFLAPSGQGFFLLLCSMALLVPMIKVLYRAKMFFLNFEYPELDIASSAPLYRWWSGFILAMILLGQVIVLLLYFLPLLLGIISLFVSELFFLQNPDITLTSLRWPFYYGHSSLFSGILSIIIGLYFWRSNMYETPRSSWLYSIIINIDTFAFFVLSGLSLILTMLSLFYRNRINFNSLIISLFIMIVSALIIHFRKSESPPVGPPEHETFTNRLNFENDSGPRISHGRRLILSELEDSPSNNEKEGIE